MKNSSRWCSTASSWCSEVVSLPAGQVECAPLLQEALVHIREYPISLVLRQELVGNIVVRHFQDDALTSKSPQRARGRGRTSCPRRRSGLASGSENRDQRGELLAIGSEMSLAQHQQKHPDKQPIGVPIVMGLGRLALWSYLATTSSSILLRLQLTVHVQSGYALVRAGSKIALPRPASAENFKAVSVPCCSPGGLPYSLTGRATAAKDSAL